MHVFRTPVVIIGKVAPADKPFQLWGLAGPKKYTKIFYMILNSKGKDYLFFIVFGYIDVVDCIDCKL